MHHKIALMLGVGLVGTAVIGAISPAPVSAQTMMVSAQATPKDVLLFPAAVMSADGVKATGKAATDVQDIVTDATREYLRRTLGAGVIVYNKRLSSVQRALAEGVSASEFNDVGDSPGKTQRIADIVNASEYLILSVSDYKYDSATHKASFLITAYRNRTQGNVPIATAAKSVSGVSATGAPTAMLEESAIARAADSAVEQVIHTVYPMPPVVPKMDVKPNMAKSAKQKESQAVKIFGVALGVLYFSTR